MKRQNSRLYKIILIITTFLYAFFIQPKQTEAGENKLSNPCIVSDNSMEAGQKVTWDCIWFGSYPQSEVIPANEEYTALKEGLLQNGDLIRDDALYQTLCLAEDWNEQGDIVIDGNKYRRIKKKDATYAVKKGDAEYISDDSGYYMWKNKTDYHYFKYEPIKWRVLSVNDKEAFLLSDKVLDNKQYHANTVYEDVTWEGSTVRSWLNGYGASSNIQNKDYSSNNFIDTAFGMAEQQVVKKTAVKNKDNIAYDSDGGNDTEDKIFLLSESEVYTNAANRYGFVSGCYKNDEARRAESSVYAKAMGIENCEGKCYWWLRTPGSDNVRASLVFYYGWVYRDGSIAEGWNYGVRPALKLDLAESSDTASNLWSYAGTVCSTNYADKLKKGDKVTDKKTKAIYRITGTDKNKTVKYIRSTKKNLPSVTIPDVVRLNGKTYKVVSVGKNAFKGNEKLKMVKIGKNIEIIETKAFYQCKNLRYIIVKTKKLSAKSIGNNAFDKGAANVKVKTDKTKRKLYYKIFTAGGMSKKALFI